MSDRYPSPDQDPSTSASRARLGAALSAMVDRYGPALFFEPDRLKMHLTQACPDASRDISLLLMALAEQVPQQLLAAHSDFEVKTLPPRLVQGLVERAGFERASAAWAVRAWTHALALPTAGLGGNVPTTRAEPPTPVDFAAVVTPWARDKVDAQRVSGAKADAESGTPDDARDRPMHAWPEALEADRVEPTTEPIVRVGEGAADRQAKPEAPFEPAWPEAVRSDAIDESKPEAVRSDVLEDSKPEAPVDLVVAGHERDRDATPVADSPSATEEVSGPSADANEPQPIVLPAGVVRDEADPRIEANGRVARPRLRALGIGATLVAIVIVIAFIAGRSTSRSPPAGEAPASARNASPAQTAPSSDATRSTAPTPDLASTQPAGPPDASPSTTSPASTTASDTKSSEATPSVEVSKQSETRDALATNAPSTASAEQPAPPSSQGQGAGVQPPAPAASSPTADARQPASSTPSTADTRQPAPSAPASVPSEDTAAALSIQPKPPSIARIDVPRVVAGRPFVIAIALDPDASNDVVSIEREVLESTARWPEPVKVTAASSLTRSKTGALQYPVAAIGRPSRSTLQFTLIDSRGERSAPKRVAFRTVSVAGRPGSIECPRATSCGTVIGTRALEARAAGRTGEFGSPAYELVIRMDDRSINRVIQGVPWRAGTRVRKLGSQYVQVRSERR